MLRLGLLAVLMAAGSAQALCLAPLCTCSVSTGGLAFGTVMPLASAPTDSSADIRLNCGGVAGLLISFRVDLGPGGGSTSARRLAGPGSQLHYNLYRDAARSLVWGEASQGWTGGFLLDLLGFAPLQALPVYGRIPGLQTTAVPGLHTDTVSVTVTFF